MKVYYLDIKYNKKFHRNKTAPRWWKHRGAVSYTQTKGYRCTGKRRLEFPQSALAFTICILAPSKSVVNSKL